MSNEPKFLRVNEEIPEGMDFPLLKRKSIDFSQDLSGDIWTDFNDHDPGITILENICYALTELSYKTHFDFEKLLFAKSNDAFDPEKNALYNIQEIFPCNPLNLDDYRKLIIDGLYPHVRNAWLLPKDKSTLGLNAKGLYKVLLCVNKFEDEQEIIQKARNLLLGHRNLSEDFDEIEVLKPDVITVTADISIDPNFAGEVILADIFFQLEEVLMPQINFKDIEHLRERGHQIEEIFKGPAPKHGIISIEDLFKTQLVKLNAIFKSRLIKVISNIEGVSVVHRFNIAVNGEPVRIEQYKVGEGHYPELDKANCNIHIYVGDIEYDTDDKTVSYIYKTQRNKAIQHMGLLNFDSITPVFHSDKHSDEFEQYYSIQNTFPEIYGITKFGLPLRSTAERKAWAKQLKAYLIPIEQVLANYLSQLVKVKHLFSIDEAVDRTFYSQSLENVPNIEDVIDGDAESLHQIQKELVKKYDNILERRNRFLNHMLARFGQEFMAESFSSIIRQAGIFDRQTFGKLNIESKIKFLKHYVDISRNRSKGFNYAERFDEENNVSGIQKKVSLLFNINDYSYKKFSDAFNPSKINYSKKSAKSKAKTALKKNTFTFKSNKRNLRSELLLFGQSRNNFMIDSKEKEAIVNFIHPISKERQQIFSGANKEECESAIRHLNEYLSEVNGMSEGFHLVEHILLRPMEPSKNFVYIFKSDIRLLKSEKSYINSFDGITSFVKEIKEFGKSAKNFAIEADGEDFVVILKNKVGKPVGRMGGYSIEKTAKKSIEEIISLFKKEEVETIAKDYTVTELDVKEGNIRSDDPYSFQLSFVIPNWSSKFQNDRVRKLMEYMIKTNAPAHLFVDVYWLGIEKMKDFEDIHYKWINEKTKPKPNFENLDEYSLDLLSFIERMKEEKSA